jgi:hypothetical protein
MVLIRIGLGPRQKQAELSTYIAQAGISKLYVFSPSAFAMTFAVSCPVEYYDYNDIIMYKTFYPLLEKIDDQSLLVFNECLRTQNRSDLTYNCAHHYCNQTPHKLIFEYFPFIESKDDFMILLDLQDKGRYKGKGFDYAMLHDEDIRMRPHHIKMEPIMVNITEKDRATYERTKERLFANLGQKDPDTIPRNLQLLAGDMKKSAIEADRLYVARNGRFGRENVLTYNEVSSKGDYTVIDMHYRRLNMNDFLKITQMRRVRYLTTSLPVDNYYANEFIKWTARLEAMYAQAVLCE